VRFGVRSPRPPRPNRCRSRSRRSGPLRTRPLTNQRRLDHGFAGGVRGLAASRDRRGRSRRGDRRRLRGPSLGSRRSGWRRRRRRGGLLARSRLGGSRRGDRGRLRGRLRRRRLSPHRQERRGVDVALGVVGHPHAEVDVGVGRDCVLARADRSHDVALGDGRPARDVDAPELKQRHRIAVRGADRDRAAAVWNGAGEADRARRRSPHRRPHGAADVDSPVLAAGVRVVAESESAEHGSVDWPRPRSSSRRCDERDNRREHDEPAHTSSSSLSVQRTRRRLTEAPAVVNFGYSEAS
jgi:hypothetical protein